MKNKSSFFLLLLMFLILPMFVFAQFTGGVGHNGEDFDWNLGYQDENISINIGSGGGWWLANPYGLPEGTIFGILSNLLFWLLAIFGIFGIIGFVISGIIYLVSAGDEGAISRAKAAMKWSIVGIIVGLSGFVIMQAVIALLSGASNRF
ncbi:MAG TPA: hypothetical protein PLF30_03640 [Candidatus Moranbacteria bacterium]|jgi:hypothetical protein|nr:hypothetical protein [Candidatus Moranbacteria bacterium]HQB59822.1 hypothetical protein [Candidatus Moranbacteria bacterium]